MDKIKQLIYDHRQLLLYLIFGFLTTVVSWGVYALAFLLFDGMGMNGELNIVVSNVISWIFAVAFAFITNKLWVFNSKSFAAKTFWYELATFVSARLLTLLIETGILFVAGMIFGTENKIINIIMKILASLIVIALNYVFSKLIIFRKRKDTINKIDDSTT